MQISGHAFFAHKPPRVFDCFFESVFFEIRTLLTKKFEESKQKVSISRHY